MVTIKDVAKAAGVAPSTVSRVIADSSRISNDTKKKVRKIMDQLGYHPNVNARNLVIKSTKAIGVIMPSSTDKALQNPFFPEVLRGISRVAHDLEYSLYVSTGENEQELFEEVQRMVNGNRVDGIVLLYSRVNDTVVDYLLERKFPFAIIGKPYHQSHQITYIDNNNVTASQEVTNHLIELGHKHIGFIGGSTDLVVTLDRLKGYQTALTQAGLPQPEEYIVHAEFSKSGGREAVKNLFSLNQPPTGLVISDDLVSLGVINMLEEIGLSVPEDISITSFNNVYLSEITTPSLTTVDINIYELGIQASKCLIEMTQTKEDLAKRIIVPHKIIYRKSAREIGGAIE